MARDTDHSGGVTLSSIALLQERFRQLQRMKELRQERELMRTLSESERCSSSRHPEVIKRPSPSSTPLPARPHCQLALSLSPDSHTNRAETWAPSDLAKRYHSSTQLLCTSPQFNLESSDSDIDTSLRL